MTYKAGDRVEFTEDYVSYAKKGDKATIESIAGESNHAAHVTLDATGHTFYVWQSRFKPLEEGFKVGDKVRIHDRGSSHKSWWGTEGVVVSQPAYDPWNATNYGVKLTKATAPNVRDGYVATLNPSNLELVPAPADKFKVGDKVKVVHYDKRTGGKPVGQTGTVTSLKNGANFFMVKIDTMNWLLTEDEIEPFTEPKPFSFEDIQEGDTIRRTETWETGSVKVLEGVVTALSHIGASTKEGLLVGWRKDSENPHITYELVNRPEPVKEPELWEDRKAGDRIVTYFKDGALDRIFTKQEDGLWGTLVSKSGSGLGKGFARSDTELAKFLSDRKRSTTAQLIES